MGAQQSCPVPSDEDFRQAAKSIATSAVASSPLLAALPFQPNETTKDNVCCFTVPSTAWKNNNNTKTNHQEEQVTEIAALGVTLVAVEQQQEPWLLVKQSHDDAIVAILRQPTDYARPLQICTPHNNDANKAAVVITYQGQAFYEYATVDKMHTDRSQHVLRVTSTASSGSDSHARTTKAPILLWRTSKSGKFKDKVIHAVSNIHDKVVVVGPNHHQNNNATTLLQAYIQELPNKQWAVHVVTGVPPLLVLAMVVAADRHAVRDQAFLRDASYVAVHNTGGRGLGKALFQKA